MNLFKNILGHPGGGDIIRQVEGEDVERKEYALEDLWVRTTVRWADGSETSKRINWSDRESVRGWARVARAALVSGGITICKKEE
jgi:hypothetical protein